MSFSDLIQKKFGSTTDEVEPELRPSPAGSLEAFIQRHGKVTEEFHFYNNTVTLRFDKEEHRYYRLGELGNLIPLKGVTTAVGIIDKSMMLTPWAAKMMAQKLLRIMPTEMVEGIIRIKALTFEEFTTIVLEAKGAHKEKLDTASDIGHMAHKCLEESIVFAIANDPEKIVRQLINLPTDEQACTAANSALVCMQNHNTRWMETETKIYSREHDYAGTMDGLAVCDSCQDKACCPVAFKDRICLIDWKSSNYLKIEYLFQTASYKRAKMEERPELKIEDIFLFRLGKSEEEAGKFEAWHMTPDEYEEDFQGFMACLNLTRLVDSVEERMKAQKGTIRAVKKEQRATAKAIAKEQEKLQKAIDKAAAKVAKELEKQRIKAEAKAVREAAKKGATHRVEVEQTVNLPLQASNAGSIPAAPTITQEVPCTSTSVTAGESIQSGSLPHAMEVLMHGPQSPNTPVPETPQPVLTISTEVLVLSPQDQAVVLEAILNPPAPNAVLKAAFVQYETEAYVPTFKIPMEG